MIPLCRSGRFRHALLAVASFVLLAVPATPSHAGEVVNCFAQGSLGECARPVLQHVKFKSVVLQFVDPQDTGLGEGLGRLLWREILESISDLSGAGVIFAYERDGAIRAALGDRDYNEFLAHEYHAAAQRIAASQDVQMSIWGVVLPDGEDLYLQAFLTLRVDSGEPWTSLSIRPRGAQSFTATIAQQRLNLAPQRVSRRTLFVHPWVTRCARRDGCPGGIELRDGPSNDAAVIARVPEGTVLDGRDMVSQWLEVDRPGGGTAYMNVYHAEMFPARVTFTDRGSVNLRNAAGTGAARVARVDLDGEYDVLAAARATGPNAEPWYRIAAGGREGWVAGRLVDRRSYLLDSVHLIAGLYRYARGQYALATRELESYLADAGNADNVTRAVALQFLAASRIAGREGLDRRVDAALGDLDRAATLTPFDPASYRMKALVHLGTSRPEAALADLDRALSLDDRDPASQRLLADMVTSAQREQLRIIAPGSDVGAVERQIRSLEDRYRMR